MQCEEATCQKRDAREIKSVSRRAKHFSCGQLTGDALSLCSALRKFKIAFSSGVFVSWSDPEWLNPCPTRSSKREHKQIPGSLLCYSAVINSNWIVHQLRELSPQVQNFGTATSEWTRRLPRHQVDTLAAITRPSTTAYGARDVTPPHRTAAATSAADRLRIATSDFKNKNCPVLPTHCGIQNRSSQKVFLVLSYPNVYWK